MPDTHKERKIRSNFSLEKILEHLDLYQLEQFEDLLAQSARGIHLVFDNVTIADTLKTTPEDSYFTAENMSKAQSILTEFLEKKGFREKQGYIDSLCLDKRELLIRTYFHLVESSIQESSEFKH